MTVCVMYVCVLQQKPTNSLEEYSVSDRDPQIPRTNILPCETAINTDRQVREHNESIQFVIWVAETKQNRWQAVPSRL
jgi:hypothetical protein